MKPRVVAAGMRFGRLTIAGQPFSVHRLKPDAKRRCVVALCDCGKMTVVYTGHLGRADISCGCNTGGNFTHRQSKTRLNTIWRSMKNRCSASLGGHPRYAGRGISVCQEWLTFEPFRIWAMANGYADNLTIDRINNDGNYEPSNCRWVTHSENNRNKPKPLAKKIEKP